VRRRSTLDRAANRDSSTIIGGSRLRQRAVRDDDPSTETLRLEQIERERTERERAQQAAAPAEQRAADRRADKAAYLRDKLEEQAERPDDAG